jgi:hypothetical protein
MEKTTLFKTVGAPLRVFCVLCAVVAIHSPLICV